MADADRLIVQVLPAADSDAEELADLAAGLRADLLNLDEVLVTPYAAPAVPAGAKVSGRWPAGW